MMDTNNYNGQEIGNYRLVEKLDCGSFGCVYRAEHLHLKRHIVAIKLLHAHLASPQKSAEFLQEAQFLYDLTHPHILPVLDVGINEKDIPYLVLEYCPNGSLKKYLQHQHPGYLPVEEAVSILTKIGQALHHAHQHNIVHRDLKPANILFNAKGEVVLTDFGIAVLLEGTTFINPYGTPAYMAPEQFQGIVSKKSDQFALGCIAYELVTGQRPFLNSRTDPPIPPCTLNPLVPPHIEQAILKALSERYTDRYEDVITFVNALEKTAKEWMTEGIMFYSRHQHEEALVAFEQAIRLEPNEVFANRFKGLLLNRLKRHEEALAALEQAIRLNPSYAPAYYEKGLALNSLKRHEEALETIEQAIRLNPSYAPAYYEKGLALNSLKRNEETLVALEQAIRLDPNYALAYYAKGLALLHLKRYEEALAAYEQTIRLDPYFAHAYLNKGLVLYGLNRDEEALVAYEQAIHLDPNFAPAYKSKGFVLDHLGKRREAEQAYEKARQLGYTG